MNQVGNTILTDLDVMKESTKPATVEQSKISGCDSHPGKVSSTLSPSSQWHGKCVAGYEFKCESKKKKMKKKLGKKYPEEMIRFVEGISDPETEGHKSLDNSKWKSPRYNTQIRYLEHKYIQCNVLKANEDAERVLPEEIKPLLINVTFLLHELKQKPESKIQENLCNAISKTASLLAELTRRPIKRSEDTSKAFDEVTEKLGAILQEHGGLESDQYETLLNEIKCLEQQVAQKDSDVNYVKDQIQEERARFMPESACLDDMLRNSIRKNQSLKAEIKYNKAQFKKYQKILAQQEQSRQKSFLELNNLRRKCTKLEHNIEHNAKTALLRPHHTDSDVFHGGSLTKYIKSKIHRDNKCTVIKRKCTVPGNKKNSK